MSTNTESAEKSFPNPNLSSNYGTEYSTPLAADPEVGGEQLTVATRQADEFANLKSLRCAAYFAVFFCIWPLAMSAVKHTKECEEALSRGDRHAAAKAYKDAKQKLLLSVILGTIAIIAVAVILYFLFSNYFNYTE